MIPLGVDWRISLGITLVVLALALASCGVGKAAGQPHGREIPGPVGVVCFGVFDDSDRIIGGNCTWAR